MWHARVHPSALFLVVDDGDRRSAIVQGARDRNIFSRIRIPGWRADLDRVYADADVVVLTSRNEGSPVALSEAMACARPVVATRASGRERLVPTSTRGTRVVWEPARDA